MIIFGITGAIGHGKSTLAEAFRKVEPSSKHLETFTIIAEVIEAWHAQTTKLPNPHELSEVNEWLTLLPPILAQTVHATVEPTSLTFTMDDIMARPDQYEKLFIHLQNLQNNPGLLMSRINDANKEHYRPILQWLGGYLVAKADSGIWYHEIMRRAEQAKAEGVPLCTIGGVRYPTDAAIVRQGGGTIILIHRPLVGEQDISDPTERERIHIQPDITILNDAGLREVVEVAQRICADFRLGRVQSRYDCMDIQ